MPAETELGIYYEELFQEIAYKAEGEGKFAEEVFNKRKKYCLHLLKTSPKNLQVEFFLDSERQTNFIIFRSVKDFILSWLIFIFLICKDIALFYEVCKFFREVFDKFTNVTGVKLYRITRLCSRRFTAFFFSENQKHSNTLPGALKIVFQGLHSAVKISIV